MHLEAQIVIHRDPPGVWRFLGSVENVAKWDRGVARTTTAQAPPGGVGTEFTTYAKADSDWGKMSYQIVSSGPDHCKLQLTSHEGNARFFKDAYWTFQTRPHPEGTLVTCCADFTFRGRYAFMAPLLLVKRSAIFTDLTLLKQAIEHERFVESNP
jgi:hypothetical protein